MKRLLSSLILLMMIIPGKSTAANTDSLKGQLRKNLSAQVEKGVLFAIGDDFLSSGLPDSALKYFSDCNVFARKSSDDSIAMEAGMGIGKALEDMGKFSAAILYFDTSILQAQKLNAPLPMMDALIDRSGCHIYEKQVAHVFPDLIKALAIARNYRELHAEANIYFTLNQYYSLFDDYAAQINYINKSIFFFDSLKAYKYVANDYYEISVVYSKLKEYQRSLQYANIADSIFKKEHVNRMAYVIKMHKGIVNKNMGNYDIALQLYRECLDSSKNDSESQMSCYTNIGIVQSLKGDLADAKQSFFKSLIINHSFNYLPIENEDYRGLGSAFLRAGQYDSALYYAKYSEELCRKNKMDDAVTRQSVALLRDIYVAKKDWGNAHIYDVKNEILQDSLYNQMQTRAFADAEARFNVNEKDKTIGELAAENELERIKDQRLIAILLLGLGVVVAGVITYRRTLRKNRLLSQQKQQLEDQKKVIDEQMLELSKAAEMRSRFMANISHELRTPATVLSGMLGMLKDKLKFRQDAEADKLNIAYKSSMKLQSMIQELLDLSKLETGVVAKNYRHERKDPAQMLQLIVHMFESLAEKENRVLVFKNSLPHPVFIIADEQLFDKIFSNLISNAIKYNKDNGEIHVSVRLADDSSRVAMSVADTGIGIDEKELPYIFDRYYQGTSPTHVRGAGAGIGLSLVNEFANIMGGHVDVTSRKGEGTTFSLTFPIVENEDGITTEPLEQFNEDWGRFSAKQNILIVEDNPELRYYLKEILGNKVNIIEAENGVDALQRLEKNIPDLIITDMMMPEMDGRELVSRLKSSPDKKMIPVIMLTALSGPENQLPMLRMGIDDYIIKPFNPAELNRRIYNLLLNNHERLTFNSQEETTATNNEKTISETDDFKERFTEFVLSNIKKTDLAVGDVARDLGYSERQLYRFTKTLTGYTPAQYIKEIRLVRAYDLVNAGSIYKVEDLAHRVGYEKDSYFAQQFFERFGKRPSEFI